MTVPAVATTPIEPPPQLNAAEESAADEGAFAALLSKEAEAPVEGEGDEAREGDAQAAAETLSGEEAIEVANEADTELLAQLLGTVLGDVPRTGEAAQASPDAPLPEAQAGRPLQAVLQEVRTAPQQSAVPDEEGAQELAPPPPKADAGNAATPEPVEEGEPVLDPAALAAKSSVRPEVARAESQAPRPVEGQNAPATSNNAAAAEIREQASAELAGASAEQRGDGEAQDDPKAETAKAPATEEAPRELATGSRFAELVQQAAGSADRPDALPTQTAPLTPPVVGPVAPTQTPTTALPPSIPAGAPNEVVPLHVEWLAARGGGTARLQLDPPNLGEVEVAVTVRGSVVDVVVRAADPAAQLAVAQTRDLLADGLASRDLRIEGFDVRGNGNESPSNSQSNPRDAANLSSGEGRRENAEGGMNGESGLPGGEGRLASSELDSASTSSRPGSSGVDLHI